jgi:hypothetical protein
MQCVASAQGLLLGLRFRPEGDIQVLEHLSNLGMSEADVQAPPTHRRELTPWQTFARRQRVRMGNITDLLVW